MHHRSRAWVQRRLRSLAVWELLNIPLQLAIWFGTIGLPMTTVNLVGFALFTLLLIQGAAYWAAKLRQVAASGGPLPFADAFALARLINVPVLAIGLLFISWAVVRDPGAGTWPGLAFGVFAVLEYVNYFHLQLMYDTPADLRRLRTQGLRPAHLHRDLTPPRRPLG
jgi:hypothetical protein